MQIPVCKIFWFIKNFYFNCLIRKLDNVHLVLSSLNLIMISANLSQRQDWTEHYQVASRQHLMSNLNLTMPSWNLTMSGGNLIILIYKILTCIIFFSFMTNFWSIKICIYAKFLQNLCMIFIRFIWKSLFRSERGKILNVRNFALKL